MYIKFILLTSCVQELAVLQHILPVRILSLRFSM